jgi:hypothetical protein
MAAGRAEFPLLEPIDVRKRRASRAADDYVHDNVVLRVARLKIYRKNLTLGLIFYKNFLFSLEGQPIPSHPDNHHPPGAKQNSFIVWYSR